VSGVKVSGVDAGCQGVKVLTPGVKVSMPGVKVSGVDAGCQGVGCCKM